MTELKGVYGIGVDADQFAVHVKLEIVVADDVAGDHLAVRIDLDDRHGFRLDVGRFCGRNLVAAIEQVGELRPGPIGGLRRHRQHSAVIGRDRADRDGSVISEWNAAFEKIFVHCLGQPLRDHSFHAGGLQLGIRAPFRLSNCLAVGQRHADNRCCCLRV